MPAASNGNGLNATGMETARLLLHMEAVNFRPHEPYRLTAGWASPVYIDCRRVISYPEARRRMVELAVEMLERNPHPSADEVRAGLEGNLCRCTGYQNIVKSILAAAEKMGG